MYYVGKLDTTLYSCITKDISTDEIIITDNQILHILDRHPEAYCEFVSHIQEAIKSPDYILADKHINTGLIIKKFFWKTEHIQIVLKLCTSSDNADYKNSIISYWKISDKRLNNYLRNKTILYKKE